MRILKKKCNNIPYLFIDHPDTDELVEWNTLTIEQKELVFRKFFANAVDNAYKELLFSLSEDEDNKDHKELKKIALVVADKYYKAISKYLETFHNPKTYKMYTELKERAVIFD